jgi:hypothetical protein
MRASARTALACPGMATLACNARTDDRAEREAREAAQKEGAGVHGPE